MKLNFCCEATPVLAVGSVYGILAFILSLDYLASSDEPVSWVASAVFFAVSIIFAINLVLFVWSLFDPEWMRSPAQRR